MSAIRPVAMHDRSRMPEPQPDLQTETVHAVERITTPAAEVTLFGRIPGLDTVRVRSRCARSRAARGDLQHGGHVPTCATWWVTTFPGESRVAAGRRGRLLLDGTADLP